MFVIASLDLLLPNIQFILLGAAFSKGGHIAMDFRARKRIYGKAHL